MLSLLFLCDAGGILKIYVMLGGFWKSWLFIVNPFVAFRGHTLIIYSIVYKRNRATLRGRSQISKLTPRKRFEQMAAYFKP